MFGKKCTTAQIRVIKEFANWVDGGSPSEYEMRIKAAQHSVQHTAFGVGILAFLAGFGVCWFIFVH